MSDTILFGPNGEPFPLKKAETQMPMYFGDVRGGDDERLNVNVEGLSLIKHYMNGRSSASEYGTLGVPLQQTSNARNIYYTRRSFLTDLYIIYFSDSVVQGMINHRKNEAFRRGFSEWKPSFVSKCTYCEKEFSTEVDYCDDCIDEDGFPAVVVKPQIKQRQEFDEWAKSVNEYGQTLQQVLMQAHEDALIVDDAFVWLYKRYSWGYDHTKRKWTLTSKIETVRRMEPELMEFDLDNQNRPKRSHFICPLNRSHTSSTPEEHCPHCDFGDDPTPPMRPALYKYNYANDTRYYTEDEIIHYSIFHPAETYGYPPILTVYEKELTLIGMDRWVYRYFYERKVPPGIIMVNTDDPDSLTAMADKMKNEMANDPTNYIPMIGINNKTGRGMVNVVRFFHTLQEMDYMPMREQIQQMLGAFYGVSPIWQGQVEGVGGISGQTQQLVVMSRVIETDQNILNNIVIPKILIGRGVTDWKKQLKTPEQKTEETILRFNSEQAGLAQQMQGMGFEIEAFRIDDDGDWVFNFSSKPKPQQQGQGGMGGMGGGMGMPQGDPMAAMGGGEGGEIAASMDGVASTNTFDLSDDEHNLDIWKNRVDVPDYHAHPGVMGAHPIVQPHKTDTPQPDTGPLEQKLEEKKKFSKESAWSAKNIHSRKSLSSLGLPDDSLPYEQVIFNNGSRAWHRWGMSPRKAHAEEIASIFSNLLGMNIVPKTEALDLGNGPATVSQCVNDARVAADFGENGINRVMFKHKKVRHGLLNMLILDYLLGNTRRSVFNWYIDKFGNIHALEFANCSFEAESQMSLDEITLSEKTLHLFSKRGITKDDITEIYTNLDKNNRKIKSFLKQNSVVRTEDGEMLWSNQNWINSRVQEVLSVLKDTAMRLVILETSRMNLHESSSI